MTTVEERTDMTDPEDGRKVELGPLFTSGAVLVIIGLIRRSALLVGAGLGAIWLDQRSDLGRSLKERARALSVQVVEDDRDQTGR